jgi:hypothetical protein
MEGRARAWLRYCPSIYLKENHKKSQDAGLRAEIWTRDRPSTKQQC